MMFFACFSRVEPIIFKGFLHWIPKTTGVYSCSVNLIASSFFMNFEPSDPQLQDIWIYTHMMPLIMMPFKKSLSGSQKQLVPSCGAGSTSGSSLTFCQIGSSINFCSSVKIGSSFSSVLRIFVIDYHLKAPQFTKHWTHSSETVTDNLVTQRQVARGTNLPPKKRVLYW